jgi:hypothetical protein
MKMLKNLFIALFAVLTITATAQAPVTHTINFTGPAVQNVTVATGDVLEFHSPVSNINFLVLFRSLATPSNVVNIAVTPSLIVSYTVVASDTSYWVKDINNNQKKGRITIASTNTLTTSIKENSITNSVRVFPNPTTDVLKVNVFNKENVRIVTQTGQLVIETDVEAGTADIDVSQLASGIYFVRIGSYTTRIIKQ